MDAESIRITTTKEHPKTAEEEVEREILNEVGKIDHSRDEGVFRTVMDCGLFKISFFDVGGLCRSVLSVVS